MSTVAAIFFSGTAHAQTTDLVARIDVTTGEMKVNITAGEPLRNPVLSILFAPGTSAAYAPQVCLDQWQIDDVRLATTDVEPGPETNRLASLRFTCSIADVAEGVEKELTVPVVVSEAAAALPVTATVGVRAGALVLETVANQAGATRFATTVCDPGGVTASGVYLPTTAFASSGTVSGSVTTAVAESAPVVELFGIDSCDQWIVRTVPTAADGTFSFNALLPGKYAVGLRDTSDRTSITLNRDNMSATRIAL